MKIQTILSLAMATVALFASCSSDEILDVPVDKTIQFSGAFVDNSTRATDPSTTTNNLTSFNVYGWVSQTAGETTTSAQIFDNVAVTKGSDNAWTYTDIQYWIAGGNYTFSAIKGYTAGDGITFTIDNNGQRATSPKIEGFKSDGTTDLIYAEAGLDEAKASGNGAVEFTFQHQLAKVKFSFLNKTAAKASIDAKITDIKITDAYETGTVVLSNTQHGASWSDQATGTLSLDFGNAGTGNINKTTSSTDNTTTGTESDNELLLIPTGDSPSYTVQFTTEIFQSDVSVKKVTRTATINQKLEAGYAYNFTAELDEKNIDPDNALEPITFTVTKVEGWVNQTTTALTTFTKVTENNGSDN
jgi:hypothetical protein